jgi:hypothetical protein
LKVLQVQPFGLHVTAKDNFIIVFAKISAVALPIPLVALISAVLLMIYHLCRNHFIDFVIIFFRNAICTQFKVHLHPCFLPRWQTNLLFFKITALINDCILVAFTVPAIGTLAGCFNTKRVKSYQHQHGI